MLDDCPANEISKRNLISSTEESSAGGQNGVKGALAEREDSFEPRHQDVIAQVTLNRTPSRDREIFSPPPPPLAPGYSASRGGAWLRKVRSVFCCFAPSGGVVFQAPTESDEDARANGAGLNLAMQEFPQEMPPRIPPPPPADAYSYVIGPQKAQDFKKKTLVLDLDETLVHSSFKPVEDPDFVIPVDIEGKLVDVYVMKRPWMDHFMEQIRDRFEIVVFTASLSKYADPLLDLLDGSEVVRWRLFREACSPYEGNYVKDLNRLGRDLRDIIIVDNSPLSYIFQPSNAVPITAFMGDKDDQELLDLLPLLRELEHVRDVREYLSEKTEMLGGGGTSSSGNSLIPLEEQQ